MTISWVIENQLARSQRPGYRGEQGSSVPIGEVDAWLEDATSLGVRSIICLLAEDQLPLYSELPDGLVAYYRGAGFSVAHIPVRDHQSPVLTDENLQEVRAAYESLPKPVLIHCSAGIDRTGMAVRYIKNTIGDPA